MNAPGQRTWWPVLALVVCVACTPETEVPAGPGPTDVSPADPGMLSWEELAEPPGDAPEPLDISEPPDASEPPDVPSTPDTPDTPATPDEGPGMDADSAPDVAPPAPEGPARYPSGQIHSPVTPWLAQRWAGIRAQAPDADPAVFMKVGDSITASSQSLFCFASDNVDLADQADLADTLAWFLAGDASGTTSFDRESVSVKGGKTAAWAMGGAPSPVDQELAAITPSTALVMFGTNDSGWFGDDTAKTLRWYAEEMFALIDHLIASGVVPTLSTIPPRTNNIAIGQTVPQFNAVIRGLAQGRQVPLVDYHEAVLPLPDFGLSGDGVHPNVLAWGQGCVLTSEGLTHGYNVRNAVNLRALDRVRRTLDGSFGPWDEASPPLAGEGAPDDPWLCDAIPFTHLSDTASSPYSLLDEYTGCEASADESGPERYYRLELEKPRALRIAVVDHGDTDVDIHLLSASGTATGCLRRAHTLIAGTLAAGEYVLVADSWVSADGTVNAGEYLLTVTDCVAGDPRCAEPIGP